MEETLQSHPVKGSACDVTDSRSYPTSHRTSGGFKKNLRVFIALGFAKGL